MYFLEKIARVVALLITIERLTIRMFHVYELFKFVVVALSTDHPVQVHIDTLKPVSQSGYDLRDNSQPEAV